MEINQLSHVSRLEHPWFSSEIYAKLLCTTGNKTTPVQGIRQENDSPAEV